ncbi:MAG: CoA transferase [Chloroflexota bacterium]|nr:CoA transferase [Chloroflexota bacterium]
MRPTRKRDKINMEQALAGVKVLDLTQMLAGPMCTKYLADFGADVIKIERPPDGDPARMLAPFYNDEQHPEKSGLFLYLNANKRGVTLNLKSEMGKKLFMEMVRDVDIVVENFKPGVMERLGLDYETLAKVNPRLVMTRISNFGQTGPYRDFEMSELTLDAMGHSLYNTGISNRGPMKQGGNCLLYQGGQVAALATMGALLLSEGDDLGQMIDFSLYEQTSGTCNFRNLYVLGFFYTGNVSYRGHTPALSINLLPGGIWPCKDDGYVHFWLANPGANAPALARALGEPELFKDPRFANYMDATHKGDMDAIIYNWLFQHDKWEVVQKCQEQHLPVAPVLTPGEAVDAEQFKAREFWVDIDHPETGTVKTPGAPWKMMDTPWQVRMPAPMLGQHNEEVFTELGYSTQEVARLHQRGII